MSGHYSAQDIRKGSGVGLGPTHPLPKRVGRGPDLHTEAQNVFAHAYFFSEIRGSGLLLTESIRAHFGKNTWFTFSPPPSPNAKLMGFLLGRVFPHLAGHSTLHFGEGWAGKE